ncbi:chromate resistance protein [Granulosicoccus sp.]|nr:chromate resistance protein ChrB domain-containing protein [Granulosicoccus sp.]MDB4224574.1 chromate resistance protein [Granulosicoccus sp.]
MASPNKISVAQLNKLVGTHNAPVLIDVRDDEDFASDPQYVPTAIRCSHLDVAQLAEGLKKIPVVVYCQKGLKLVEGASAVEAVAEKFNGVPFDIEGVFWSHREELCTFDVMVNEFGLNTEPLLHLAAIVRAADTNQPELAAESKGLLAASLGLSRMFSDDLAQLDAGCLLYDAFYRWCRDATNETHDWPGTAVRS